MCEPKGFGPLFGLACGQQSPLVGFLGAFSLQLSFGVQKKVRKQFRQVKSSTSGLELGAW
jgi:hypothetical protein